MPRIYFDYAATSWPKPESVYRAVENYQRRLGAPAGRGAYAEAAETERTVAGCRQRIAELIGAADPKRIVFTQNGTDSLNLALLGLLRPGDHVVTTVCEHNSVLRPLRFLAEHRDVAATYVSCDAQGYVDPVAIRRAFTPKTRLIALVHASNVTGAIQPVEEVGRIANEHGVPFLVDAAQSLGYVAVDVRAIGCHLLAAPGSACSSRRHPDRVPHFGPSPSVRLPACGSRSSSSRGATSRSRRSCSLSPSASRGG
jgi:selenocysteine lyase/cysteine desulfurase